MRGTIANVAEIIASIIIDKQPTIVIIDSIQTMFVEDLSSAPGTVSQVRASAFELTVFAKKFNVTLLIVSHVTKDGQERTTESLFSVLTQENYKHICINTKLNSQ